MSSELTKTANENIKGDAPYNRSLLLRRLAKKGAPISEPSDEPAPEMNS